MCTDHIVSAEWVHKRHMLQKKLENCFFLFGLMMRRTFSYNLFVWASAAAAFIQRQYGR